jgi:O-methyltransferase involved in polyketide biosynthesis
MTELTTDALTGVSETLLIPLAARMIAPTRHPDLQFRDDEAIRIGAALGFDPGRFADDTGSMRGSVIRASWFDRIARTFVERHPDGLCLSIGSGLDNRPARIGLPATVDWIDIDFAAVVRLREAVIPRTDNLRTLTASEAEPLAWMDAVGWSAGRPVLVLVEGVMMYLAPAEGVGLLRTLVARATDAGAPVELAADFASPLMVRQSRRNPSVAQTGARFHWAVARPEAVGQIAPGLTLIAQGDVMRRCGISFRVIAVLYRLLTGRPIYFCAHYRYRPADFG